MCVHENEAVDDMRHTLKILAPYLAVAVFWCAWPSAWLAILVYHVQILLWNGKSLLRDMRGPAWRKGVLLAVPAAVAGPILYLLLPVAVRTDLSAWLEAHRLSGAALAAMIPYFGLVHPVLEQAHWGPLREKTAWAHPLFAGYHVIVLSTLLSIPWLLLCFSVLIMASLAWRRMARLTGGLAVPAASHVLADLGIVLAAWVRTM
jgi:hypothetical protein